MASGKTRIRSIRRFKPQRDRLRFGDFRRLTPISRAFGFERGTPVDRYYIERFLAGHAGDIHGRVVEVGDDLYTTRFGGDRVVQAEILNIQRENNPKTTIVADLARPETVSAGFCDCFIFTQTLQFIYDLKSAVGALHRALKPQGVLLASFPAISQVCRYDMERWGDYWRFTNAAVERLLAEAFPREQIQVSAHGNVLAALCFLHGLAAEDLRPEELDFHDPDYQIVITARAVKVES
jgi:hypothetical protein